MKNTYKIIIIMEKHFKALQYSDEMTDCGLWDDKWMNVE
jgi:hypothetical protein